MDIVTENRRPAVYGRQDIIDMLSIRKEDKAAVEKLKSDALRMMEERVGTLVYYRGIVEFSNICMLDCRYCGIRRGNSNVEKRYTLAADDVVGAALWCAEQGYGSVVLQSGQRQDESFIGYVENIVRRIKTESVSDKLPEGLGITLSVGEQSLETYARFREAGAHRYLLRIESSNPALYAKIHPQEQRFDERLECLGRLRDTGYQVGTGVMIGLPGQSIEMLADDILFFRDMDIDMIGMGPYITHPDVPMAAEGMMDRDDLLQLSLNMIAAARLALKDVNIAATTALQALVSDGRERGLSYGANVTMPNLTPKDTRSGYQLYSGKPCVDESREECRGCLLGRVRSTGRDVGFDMWGDSPHALAKV